MRENKFQEFYNNLYGGKEPSRNWGFVLARTGPVFVDVYGHLGIDSKNRFRMKN
jgi:hypothetical protein